MWVASPSCRRRRSDGLLPTSRRADAFRAARLIADTSALTVSGTAAGASAGATPRTGSDGAGERGSEAHDAVPLPGMTGNATLDAPPVATPRRARYKDWTWCDHRVVCLGSAANARGCSLVALRPKRPYAERSSLASSVALRTAGRAHTLDAGRAALRRRRYARACASGRPCARTPGCAWKRRAPRGYERRRACARSRRAGTLPHGTAATALASCCSLVGVRPSPREHSD